MKSGEGNTRNLPFTIRARYEARNEHSILEKTFVFLIRYHRRNTLYFVYLFLQNNVTFEVFIDFTGPRGPKLPEGQVKPIGYLRVSSADQGLEKKKFPKKWER